ncbi:MAG: ATP-binding protein, partial [Candidatus Cybelea sp.]
RMIGLQIYRLQLGLLPAVPAELESFVRLWERECLLLSVGLYLDVDADGAGSQAAFVDHLLDRLTGVVFLATRNILGGGTVPPIVIEAAKPTAEEQRDCWATALGPESRGLADQLAAQFNLDIGTIREIVRRSRVDATPASSSSGSDLWDLSRGLLRPRLDVLAQRVVPGAGWDDIVLPSAESALLRRIADQVGARTTVYKTWGFGERMTRGLGISVLFAGPTGCGKTMAAEVIANDLQLDLFRIDLSAVVSKYIGETEKNLRRLFDAAEDGGAILFFDEADALFGKRSEVKDSHDRYANIEINYLLQRMESYGGLAILATNVKSSLDQAFLRRLRFVVDFPFPAAAERKAIWQKTFPAKTPTDGLDFDRLARLSLTGGSIAVIALNAAFQAARAGTPVTMPIVLDAARIEFRKLARPVNETDFRWQVRSGAVA